MVFTGGGRFERCNTRRTRILGPQLKSCTTNTMPYEKCARVRPAGQQKSCRARQEMRNDIEATCRRQRRSSPQRRRKKKRSLLLTNTYTSDISTVPLGCCRFYSHSQSLSTDQVYFWSRKINTKMVFVFLSHFIHLSKESKQWGFSIKQEKILVSTKTAEKFKKLLN